MTATRFAPVGRTRYATVAIVLHWIIALAIVTQVSLAWRFADDRSPTGFALTQLHKSIGVTILFLSLIRLGWRLANPPPPEPAGLATWERVLSKAVHWGFYAIMIGMPLTGWLMVSASRTAIPTVLFWTVHLANIPGVDNLSPAAKGIARRIGQTSHELLAFGFYGLFVLHIGGALKHQLFERNIPVLARIAPGSVSGRWWEPRLWLIALAVVGAAAFGWLVQPPHPASGPAPAEAAPAEPFLPEAAPAAPGTPATAAPPAAGAKPAAAAPTGAVAWKVAPGSSLNFQTSWSGDAVHGRFNSWKADILFGPDALDKSKVVVTIDMTSAKTGDDQRDASLPASDWFDAAAHPKAVFTATKFEKKGEGAYVAHGTLDLRGVSKPVDLPFKLKIVGDKAQMSGETSLDRTLFGVGQGEFTATDQVPAKVTVRVQLNAQTTAAGDKR
ncbi:YceI family protein [Phenylobacterium sp.]|uniref:YceI family protein n=1 Tax=Phenylobacterium sp. TaxID=1871053 RepID=UPI002E30D420|nr:YceI family protein [Phenylobacterium sp.]HEX3366781.1 YceI family protein [Phenylobacterium sp.]